MTNPILAVVWTIAALLSTGLPTISADAQNPSTTPTPQQTRPLRPNGGSADTSQQSTNPTANQPSLGNELSHSRGVIRPPPTGDQAVVPPPPTSNRSTPVIPPPGTPGGNQNIQPK